MDRIIQQIIRQITRRLMRQGVNMAMDAGAKALKTQASKVSRGRAETIDQDPAVTERRRLKPDEQKGDDVLYPTDDFTEDMQPRR